MRSILSASTFAEGERETCSQIEALSAALEEERRLGRAKDARHKLTVQRLQRHVVQLQVHMPYLIMLHIMVIS